MLLFHQHRLQRLTFSARRCLQTKCDRTVLLDDLRSLLRQVAQPVTVLTTGSPPGQPPASNSSTLQFHGATVSSFASIAFEPTPIVAFALRLPSRMADRLSLIPKIDFGINILSESQADTARAFSRPDLFPKPFEMVPYHLDGRGIPLLDNCVGTLICTVLHSYHLDKWDSQPTIVEGDATRSDVDISTRPCLSSLFLARVKEVRSNTEGLLPLVYYNGQYSTITRTDAL
jgi:flavin reductase (DIM6/NTAB) family NADH-FMN oxidoreductase RutF